MEEKAKQKGVTLIALVITIIVLIILAGVSINTLIGDNGIITKAQQAKENILLAQEEETKQLNQLYSQLNYIEGGEINGDKEAIEKLLNFKKVIATAITKEGVNTQETDTAEVMASNIGKILVERTKNATATAEDIKVGKTAWVNGNLLSGSYQAEPFHLVYSNGVILAGKGIGLNKTIGNYTISIEGNYILYAIVSSSNYEEASIQVQKNGSQILSTGNTTTNVVIKTYELTLNSNDILDFQLTRTGDSNAACAGTILLIKK